MRREAVIRVGLVEWTSQALETLEVMDTTVMPPESFKGSEFVQIKTDLEGLEEEIRLCQSRFSPPPFKYSQSTFPPEPS